MPEIIDSRLKKNIYAFLAIGLIYRVDEHTTYTFILATQSSETK